MSDSGTSRLSFKQWLSFSAAILSTAPLLYYAYAETRRYSILRKRDRLYRQHLSHLDHQADNQILSFDLKQEHYRAVKARFASLSVAGRYVNPFFEWHEQGMSAIYYTDCALCSF